MATIRNPVPARLRGEEMRKYPGDPTRQVTWVKGTAPSMTSDLEDVFRRVQKRLPAVKWEQLSVTHPADDDGLWFLWIPDLPGEVQIESSLGVCPFLVETDKHDDCLNANSPEETSETIIKWLQLPGGRSESPWHARETAK
jgi:hypothetical protein